MNCYIRNAVIIKTYTNELDNDTIPLPLSEEQVEVVSFRANEFAHTNLKSVYSKKLKRCNDTDRLTDTLAKAPMLKQKSKVLRKCKPHLPKPVPKLTVEEKQDFCINDIPLECAEIDLTNTYYTNHQQYGKVYAKQGYAISAETQEILWECKTLKSLREAWLRQSYYIYNCACWHTSLFVSIKLDTYPTFNEMNKLVSNYTVSGISVYVES